MPRSMPQHMRLFVIDPTDTTITAVFNVPELTNFVHSSRLPGGFTHLEFVTALTETEFWQWFTERMVYRLLLEESGGRVIWEGRLQDVELVGQFATRLRFFGYWANFADHYHNADFDATGDAIIQTLRNAMDDDDANALQLSTSNAEMDTGPTIDADFQTDFSMWRIITDRRGILSFGSVNNNPMDLTIYEDRIIRYKERDPSTVDWQTFFKPQNGGGASGLRSRRSWAKLANATSATYESTGTVTRTTPATNTASIARYFRKEYQIPNIGESDATAAGLRSDAELVLRKDLQQEQEGFHVTRVWDTNGIEWPLCRVRAGEVIRINDFVPTTGDLDTLTLDAFRTFVIEVAECNHQTGKLKIQPDREAGNIVDALIRNGIT